MLIRLECTMQPFNIKDFAIFVNLYEGMFIRMDLVVKLETTGG